jgi:hypothetical protein
MADSEVPARPGGPRWNSQDVIFDPETRKSVAVIRNGAVFRDDKEGARIAYLVGSSLYDPNGNFLGRLDGMRAVLANRVAKTSSRRILKALVPP